MVAMALGRGRAAGGARRRRGTAPASCCSPTRATRRRGGPRGPAGARAPARDLIGRRGRGSSALPGPGGRGVDGGVEAPSSARRRGGRRPRSRAPRSRARHPATSRAVARGRRGRRASWRSAARRGPRAGNGGGDGQSAGGVEWQGVRWGGRPWPTEKEVVVRAEVGVAELAACRANARSSASVGRRRRRRSAGGVRRLHCRRAALLQPHDRLALGVEPVGHAHARPPRTAPPL